MMTVYPADRISNAMWKLLFQIMTGKQPGPEHVCQASQMSVEPFSGYFSTISYLLSPDYTAFSARWMTRHVYTVTLVKMTTHGTTPLYLVDTPQTSWIG